MELISIGQNASVLQTAIFLMKKAGFTVVVA
jgi:hypothetical protein